MYHEFYQLKEDPFNMTADPDFFYSSKCHHEAISHLVYGIEQRKGLIVITGEVGTGKTTLCRTLLRRVDKNVKFALILNPTCSETQLLQMIAHDLGITGYKEGELGLTHSINEFLLGQASLGNNVVIVIDEAQLLSVAQLEHIRLLSNLDTEKDKLIQIILIGQPELRDKLKLPELRQLRQRITIFFQVHPLQINDIRLYIQHRLHKAKVDLMTSKDVYFTDRAIEKIYHYTQGSPRTINILCDRALLAGFVAETHSIDESIIENSAREVIYCEHNL